jgi:hypothetical protein
MINNNIDRVNFYFQDHEIDYNKDKIVISDSLSLSFNPGRYCFSVGACI